MITPNLNTATFPSFLIHENPTPEIPGSGIASGPSQGKAHGKRILVIDDESNIADSLAEILIDHGYDAVAFYEGQAAIDFVRNGCPALVISDVVMPNLNGVETALAIQELCPATHIWLFSGQASTANILEKARRQGHDFELLPKPIHPAVLLKKLSALGN
jgi:DNA-binding NtrC family response regulator